MKSSDSQLIVQLETSICRQLWCYLSSFFFMLLSKIFQIHCILQNIDQSSKRNSLQVKHSFLKTKYFKHKVLDQRYLKHKTCVPPSGQPAAERLKKLLRQLTSDEAQANFSEIMKGTPSIAKKTK